MFQNISLGMRTVVIEMFVLFEVGRPVQACSGKKKCKHKPMLCLPNSSDRATFDQQIIFAVNLLEFSWINFNSSVTE